MRATVQRLVADWLDRVDGAQQQRHQVIDRVGARRTVELAAFVHALTRAVPLRPGAPRDAGH